MTSPNPQQSTMDTNPLNATSNNTPKTPKIVTNINTINNPSHLDKPSPDTPILDTLSLDDFDYDLPDTLIARTPLAKRSAARLLHINGDGIIHDNAINDLPNLLNAGDLVVFNDTKVMKARLFGQKDTGGAVEVLIERILPNSEDATYDDFNDHNQLIDNTSPTNHNSTVALCHIRASRSPKIGQSLILKKHPLKQTLHATLMTRQDNLFILKFDRPILQALEQFGELPIPPYFDRNADDNDDTRYQTVFFDPNKLASVAAPTASLHFDNDLLNRLTENSIGHCFVTLHVGAGTFAPVKAHHISQHKMHKEYAELPQSTAEHINQTKKAGGNIIAIGTTVTRVLETAYLHQNQIKPQSQFKPTTLQHWAGDTDIFIYPPYRFGVVDRLLTNFHLPKSTLLMLVSAFAGTEVIRRAYAHAIAERYRFFSYGDAMLIDTPKSI